MRALITVVHFFGHKSDPTYPGQHGSLGADPRPRQRALAQCILSLHRLFHPSQCILNIAARTANTTNEDLICQQLDVVVVTTGDHHLVNSLPNPGRLFLHHSTTADPLLLGFECQSVLRDNLGKYDYYCYLEDDLILRDPWFFRKLAWFNTQVGDEKLLLPNRYETGEGQDADVVFKAYLDGDLAPRALVHSVKGPFDARLRGKVMGSEVEFVRALNPHSGCYFLNSRQMSTWVQTPHFLDRDTSFIGPLESAATLGIMRTFPIYKPATKHASFLEIEHFGSKFLRLIRRSVPTPNAADQLPRSD